jgi:hypothetical protein
MQFVNLASAGDAGAARDRLEQQLLIAFLRDLPTLDIELALASLHDGPAGGGASSVARRRSR